MKVLQFYPDRKPFIICMICFLTIFFSMPMFSQDPIADFTADQTSGCPDMVVIFTDQSKNADSWSWSFPGGNPLSAQTQGPHQVTYSNIGSFDVSLKIEGNNRSDKKYETDYITVNDCSPTANFSVSPSSGCSPLTVTYTDQSVDATTWNWSFPGGWPSAAQTQGPHLVTYTDPGSYSATLTVYNQYGQDAESKNSIVNASRCFDFGDAPLPFKTMLQDNGARHIIDPDVYLGSGVSTDADGQLDSLASGDDDDGVTFLNDWVLGDTARFEITASVDGYIRIWYASSEHLGELTVEEDFEYQDSENVKVKLFKGGKATVKVSTSKFLEAGDYWMRIRFSTDSSFSHFGEAPDGEVEDYLITIRSPYDYGDAPDDDTHFYETLFEHNGARHPVDGITYLANSTAPSVEPDGQPDRSADWDGGTLEENGVIFHSVLSPGETTTIQAYMKGAAYLHGWIDFNCNGDFHDSGEYFLQFDNTALPYEETRLFDLDTPVTAVPGRTYVRFRYCTDPAPFTPGGLGGFGEVEDQALEIFEHFYDYGDAPDCYNTTGDDAARHPMNRGIVLGVEVDSEPVGLPSVNADGDDTNNSLNDEEGVTFSEMNPGVTTIMTILANGPGYLYAWIDFNQDGDFEDSDENIISGDRKEWETTDYTIDVPADAIPGDTYARFRYVIASMDTPPVVNSYGTSLPGEVEDYKITIGSSTEVEDLSQVIPEAYALNQNYPNPFNHVTNISYALCRKSHTCLMILNTNGQTLRSLVNEIQPAGIHTVHWKGLDNNDIPLSSGVYIVHLHSGSFCMTKKLILMK